MRVGKRMLRFHGFKMTEVLNTFKSSRTRLRSNIERRMCIDFSTFDRDRTSDRYEETCESAVGTPVIVTSKDGKEACSG